MTVLVKITHDIFNAAVDSLGGMVIPLCYYRTNPDKYCSLSSYWNNTFVVPLPGLERSIFRHMLPDSNWMMTLSEAIDGSEWDTRDLVMSGDSTFFLSLIGTGAADPLWWGGDRVLTATMTFRVEDTMTICVDTCFWPPLSSLAFARKDHVVYTPQLDSLELPVCFKVDTAASGVREIHGSEDTRPSEFSLSRNYPNPFNPITNIEFSLSKAAHVKIDIFNIVGQRVRTLVDEEMKSGRYVADWDGKDEQGNSVSSGIYFYRMQADDFSDMKKMLLVK